MRRGAIVAAVACLHAGLIALLFGSPTTPRSTQHATHDALQVRWVRWVRVAIKPPGVASRSGWPPPARLMPPRNPAAQPAVKTTTPAVFVTKAGATSAPTPDYRSPLFDGRSTLEPSPTRHVPGSDMARMQGIRLRAAPTLQQLMRTLATNSRCKYSRMKMARSANQFVTRQLMERALEADGCGPHSSHAPGDDAIELITQQELGN